MKIKILIQAFTISVVSFFAVGCGESHDHHDHSSHHHHVHTAPHGGILIELGHHQFNIELYANELEGKWSLYVLDAHAEQFLRIAMPKIEAVFETGTQKKDIKFLAVANESTGETVGDTAQFDWNYKNESGNLPTGKLNIKSVNIGSFEFKNIQLMLAN